MRRLHWVCLPAILTAAACDPAPHLRKRSAAHPGSAAARAAPRDDARAPATATPRETRQAETPRPPAPQIVLPEFDSPSPGPGATPRQTYEAAKACVSRQDYLGVWELMSERARARADGALPPTLGQWRYTDPQGFRRLFGRTTGEFEQLPIPQQYALLSLRAHRVGPEGPRRFIESQFVSESCEGNTAVVVYRTSDGKTVALQLVREGGVWRLARTGF